jgi:Zn-finger nucleic acid-binding protein
METVTIDNVTVDRCTNCKGIWFDANEQKQLLKSTHGAAIDIGDIHTGRKMDQIRDIKCPRCQAAMVQTEDVDQHHITFEACLSCNGIFLDAGEFKDLKEYTFLDYLRGLFKHAKKTK